jgi:hypothetical protein
MTTISKVRDDVIECVSIGGTLIDLRTVSPALRARYHAVSRRVGHYEAAKADLKDVGKEIIAEQAVKVAPRKSGRDAVSKLMGFKK